MRKFSAITLGFLLVLLSACVTINVYFPAAAAEKAAEQFIGTVIGNGPAAEAEPERQPPPRSPQASVADWFIGSAQAAEPDLSIQSKALREIQSRMKQRFDSVLVRHLATGAIGLTRDGLIAVRDATAAPLGDRAALNQAIADENRDRKAAYREIAVANGHPEWETQIQTTFAAQWIEQARPGWYHQDATGAWKQR